MAKQATNVAKQDSVTAGRPAPGGPPAGAHALRALAHPLRWELIDLLEREGQATATRCAEIVGESVASCAYHLNILGKYGYARHVPRQPGREKPWELTSVAQNLSPAGTDPESLQMAAAAVDAFLDHELARLKARFRRRLDEPAAWREGLGVLGETAWLTAEETAATWAAMRELILGFADRAQDPAARPEGSREVRLFAASSVAPSPAGARPAASADPSTPASHPSPK
jgi:hypothetical protein